MEKEITIEGEKFELVTVQTGGRTSVYKSTDKYLRLGESEAIGRDLKFHRMMEQSGFPVASILSEGVLGDQNYFIEASLGEKHLGNLFAEDMSREGVISSEHFHEFLEVAKRFGEAQLKSKKETGDFTELAKGIHLQILGNEFPDCSTALMTRFKEATQRLSVFPFVITHGDFNPNNLYPKGAIDLEDSFWGPFGYDLITALTHIDTFPDSKEYEYFAKYRYTKEQAETYLSMCDDLSNSAGLPRLSDFKEDFAFCRAVWSAARMESWPKLRKFRYDLLMERFLNFTC